MTPIASKGFIAGTSPFVQFATFIQSLPLTPHKHLFKTYPLSFTGEDAINTVRNLAHDRIAAEEAEHLVITYQSGGLIRVLAFGEGKGKVSRRGVYVVTGKGWGVVSDVRNGNLGSADGGDVIYLDRTEEGHIILSPPTIEQLFKTFAGERPNVWTPEKQREKDSASATGHDDSSGEVSRETSRPVSRSTSRTSLSGKSSSYRDVNDSDSERTDSATAPVHGSILVKDRLQRMKTYTNTLHGSDAVDWIFDHVAVMSRDEAVYLASVFAANGWLAPVDPSKGDDGKSIRDGNGLYQITPLAAKLAGWSKDDTPTVKGWGAIKQKTFSGFSSDDARISIENLAKFDNFLRKSQEMLAEKGGDGGSSIGTSGGRASVNIGIVGGGGAQGWEDDGQMPAPSSNVTVAPGVLEKEAPASGGRRKRAATVSGQPPPLGATAPPQRGRIASVGGQTPDLTSIRPWEQLKESNTTKLATILKLSNLRAAFRSFLQSMYCPENIDFLEDTERFRLMYGGQTRSLEDLVFVEESQFGRRASTLQKPSGMPAHIPESITEVDSAPSSARPSVVASHLQDLPPPITVDPLLIAHAIALYLKYVPRDAPQEVNIGSNLKKQIGEIVSQVSNLFPLINTATFSAPPPSLPTSTGSHRLSIAGPPSIPLIDPTKILQPGTQLSAFPTEVPGFNPDMFATAEAHVFRMLAGDSVPKFLKTDAYHTIMAKLWSEGVLPMREEANAAAAGEKSAGGAARGRFGRRLSSVEEELLQVACFLIVEELRGGS
ncbi:hypothetical protein HDV00_001362 [Rhizophlyctis rosea]|nr:hypothetical protein HDV00_001362 [Rhizophlyctis rosea]